MIYADADIIELFYSAVHQYYRGHRDELDSAEVRRLNVARSLLMRDWPGAHEDEEYFQEHGLSFELGRPNEWSHEHEMRLVMPDRLTWSSWGMVPNVFYWLFDKEAVAHLLWPASDSSDVEGFAAAVANDPAASWALDVEVRLIGTDGLPSIIAPLSTRLD